MKKGLLLINLGTPKSNQIADIRYFLKEFLIDRRVVNLPGFLRYILLYCYILPFRSKSTYKAYNQIWTNQGSPLLIHSVNLVEKIQKKLENTYKVVLGMRYGTPSLASAMTELEECEEITVLPLYPQYSSAATGSTVELLINLLKNKPVFPSLNIIRDFYSHPNYIEAQAKLIAPLIDSNDFILFSYHGIPESHLYDAGCKQICINECFKPVKPSCYRAQCYATTEALISELKLNNANYMTTFQSRVGKNPWLKPYITEVLPTLLSKGIHNLVVVCPSFVADCLETLEEINIRLRQQWLSLGGNKFTIVPALNSEDYWVNALINIAKLQTSANTYNN